MKPNDHQKNILSALAEQLMETANHPDNIEKFRLWNALRDLCPERPMILAEVETVLENTIDAELECSDEFLRSVEKNLRMKIIHTGIGDDFVVRPYVEIPWDIQISDYGVPLNTIRAENESLAYVYDNPLHGRQDAEKLVERSFACDREACFYKKSILENILGDVIEVRMSLPDYTMHTGLTSPLFSLIGMENMMLWTYDDPELFHFLMDYLCEDKLRYFKWLENEGLLSLNNEIQLAGSGSPGFTTGLPAAGFSERDGVRLSDLWCFAESQETLNMSPIMYTEFVLPYVAKLSSLFGYVYYGCCEPLHDRIPYIKEAFHNLKSVSVSAWSDKRILAEELGGRYVYSYKPLPSYMSGQSPNWDAQQKELDEVQKAARDNGCKLEIILRDVYDVGGNIGNFKSWAEMAKARLL